MAWKVTFIASGRTERLIDVKTSAEASERAHAMDPMDLFDPDDLDISVTTLEWVDD